MPSALVNCDSGYAFTVIQNTSDCPKQLTICQPFTVTPYENTEYNINFTTTNTPLEIDKLLEENLDKLRLDHTNGEEREKIYALCREYKDIFYCDQIPLTFTNQVKHHIRTKNEDPIYIKPYRQAPFIQNEINNQVEKLLHENVIQESHSPWSAPVHLVPKKKDASGEIKYRMVIDYRRLNDITIDDKYPLPNINDLFDKLGKSVYFTTLDLASGYHQIEVEEKDRQKTAFSTQNGHFEFLRMPFGLKTAPATFQRTMDNILRGLQGLHCMVYLDDIIIYGNSLDEMINKLRIVFDRLRTTNMKIQLDKSEFLRKEVLYLGHTITKDGLKPNDDKINAVLNYPLPKTTTEIKSFLGLVGYYRRFIKDFAKITQPLTACLKKRNKIVIDQKYIDAFNKCKELLTHAPLLQYPDYDKTFILTTDASNVALGAVLSQGQIGSDKPIAYASRTLSDTESRYSTIERELLAIVWAVKHFRPYLYGRKFYIYTDHRPLTWLQSLKDPSSKLTRWRLRLQDYDFDLIHKNGKQNTNADALSRIKINALLTDDENQSLAVNIDEKEDKNLNECADSKGSSTVTISDSSRTMTCSPIDFSDNIREVHYDTNEYPIRSVSSKSNETVHSAVELESTGIPILHEAIDTKPNQILIFSWFKNQMHVKNLSRDKQKILEVFLPKDNPQLVKDFLKEYIQPKLKYFIYFEENEHRKLFSNIIIELFRKGTINLFECTERVIFVEDEGEQKALILKYHEGKTCHRGIKETCGILLMTVTMLSLALHLQNLEGNPGVLPVKQGHAYFQTDQWTIVKIISLDQIYTDLNYISTNYQALCNLIDWNASYSQEIMTIKMHTDSIRDLTVEKYQQLIPSKRSKRGLINPLGSIIKIVTGNLDHDDALKPFSAGARFLCTADNRIPFYELTCVEQLMNFENDLTLCKQHPIEIEQVRVQQVANNNWILYSEEKTTLTERCKDETSRQLVFGTYLMTIEEPCEVEIHGIHINHRIFIESDVVKRVPIIALPQLRTNAQLSSTRALDMKGINLDEVKYMAYSLKHSEVIESVFDKRDSSFSASLVYVTLGLVILSIFVFSVYVVRLKLLKYTCFKKNYRNQSKIDSPDNFPLKVGGAMVTTQPSALD
nr:uncharacterized protein LOC126055956 [Helicoverpa armigera]